MPGPLIIRYHGREFVGRRALADELGIGMPLFKNLTKGNPVEEWQGILDRYLRRRKLGPLRDIPVTREEILENLSSEAIKRAGIVVSLKEKHLYLEFILAETTSLGTEDVAERIYCWLEKLEEVPRCTCTRPRSFKSVTKGHFPTCGMDCPDGHAAGRPAVRQKIAAAVVGDIELGDGSGSDDDRQEALRTLKARIDPKHLVMAAQSIPWLCEWIESTTTHLPVNATWPERIHVVLTGESPICPHGKRRKVRRLSGEYLFCGHQKDCPCSHESTKLGVSETILQTAPPGYITLHQWAQKHGIGVSTALKDIRKKRMPALEEGRNYFVRVDTPPPPQEELVTCRHCGKAMRSISNTHLATHGMTREQYIAHYGGPMIGSHASNNISSGTLGFMASLSESERWKRYSKSKPEEFFFDYLTGKGLVLGDTVRRQVVFPEAGSHPYDFYLPREGIIVEIDGPQHWRGWVHPRRGNKTQEELFERQKRKDEKQAQALRAMGLKLVRVRVIETLHDYPEKDFQSQLRDQGFPRRLLDDPL